MFHGETHKEKIRLRGKDIIAKVGEVKHIDLQFYPENPRIYSIVHIDGKEPSQNEIFNRLKKMEHVKQLVQNIKANDGLHEPIIVQRNIVLEGNSRLAAYRLLYDTDPIKWGLIKAKVLPEDTSEKLIFALLGEYHLIGKKDWAPYEQAGFLYRRHYIHKINKEQISIESGLSKAKVNHLIKVYKYMVDKGQNSYDRWSYFDEYIKSRYIKKMRRDFPEMDDVIIEKINNGEISRAVDVRDKLKVIAKSNDKNKKKFVSKERDFDTAFHSAIDQGCINNCLKKLEAFRSFIKDLDTEKTLLNQDQNILNKCKYEIKKIKKRIDKIHEKLE